MRDAIRTRNLTARRITLGLVAFYLALMCAAGSYPTMPRAYADGGAPNLAYVAGASQGISVIDVAQQKVTSTFPLGGEPHMVYLSPDGRYLYVSQPALNRVTVLAAAGGKTVCSANVPGQPSLLTADPGTGTLYVAGSGATGITGLDVNNCARKRTISTSSPVYGMFVAQVGAGPGGGTSNQLWYTTRDALNVYENASGQISSIPIPGGPQYITIPSGATIYVSTRAGTVVAVSLQTRQVTPPLISGGDFGPMDYDQTTSEIYVPDRSHNKIDVLTPVYFAGTSPREPNHIISLGVSPRSIAVTSDGNLGFVALANGHVAMLDIPGKTLVTTIFVGGNPTFIITGLYPPQANGTGRGIVLPLIAGAAAVVLLVIALLLFLALRRKQRM